MFSVLDAKANEGYRDRHFLNPLVRVREKRTPKWTLPTRTENKMISIPDIVV